MPEGIDDPEGHFFLDRSGPWEGRFYVDLDGVHVFPLDPAFVPCLFEGEYGGIEGSPVTQFVDRYGIILSLGVPVFFMDGKADLIFTDTVLGRTVEMRQLFGDGL